MRLFSYPCKLYIRIIYVYIYHVKSVFFLFFVVCSNAFRPPYRRGRFLFSSARISNVFSISRARMYIYINVCIHMRPFRIRAHGRNVLKYFQYFLRFRDDLAPVKYIWTVVGYLMRCSIYLVKKYYN